MKLFERKRTALLLLAALSVSALASCGEAAAPVSGENADNTLPVETEEVTAAPAKDIVNWESANLPVVDYGGKAYNILTYDNSNAYYAWRMLDTASLDGEVMNDAIYNRNRKIEGIYNIKINSEYSTAVSSGLSKSVKAGDNAYDAGFDAIGSL